MHNVQHHFFESVILLQPTHCKIIHSFNRVVKEPKLALKGAVCQVCHLCYVCFVSDTESTVTPCSDSFSATFLSVGEDVENIIDKINTIITKLDEEMLKLCAAEASTEDATPQEIRDPKETEQPEDDKNHLNSDDPLESDSGQKQGAEDGDDQSPTRPPSPDSKQTSDSRFSSSDCNNEEETGKESEVKSQGSGNKDCVSPDCHTDFLQETEKDTNKVNEKGKEETNKEWITVG